MRSDSCLSKSVSHAWSLSDTVRHTIDQAELSWQVVTLLCDLHKEHGLLDLSDSLVVALLKVLSHRNDISLVLKGHSHRVYIEHNISDEVGSLVAPVCDDRLVTELKSSYLLPTVLVALAIVFYFEKSLETTFSGHKLEN